MTKMNFGNSIAIATNKYVGNINNRNISSLRSHKFCDENQIFVAVRLATSNIATKAIPSLFLFSDGFSYDTNENAEPPPMRKSVAKVATPSSAGAFTNTGEAFAVIIDRLSPHVCPQRSSRIKYQLETSYDLNSCSNSMEDHIFSHFNAILLLITITLSSIFIYKLTQKSQQLSDFPPEISGVVSSYDAVKDCLNVNEKVFAARPGSLAGEYIVYNNAMLFLASYGDYWRKIRKIVINEVLSSSKLEKLRDVRVSKVKTSIKDLYSLFPITGDQNLDFPVTADHFPVTRDNFPVGGDDISFIVDGDNVIKPKKQPLTEIQGKDSYNKVFLSDPSLDPTHGGSFSAKGDKVIKSWKQPMVEMQDKTLYNSAHSDCFSAPYCLVSGANLDFPVTGGNFQVKVNITNWIEKLTLSLIVKMIAGKSYGRVEKGGNEEEAERFKKALKDFMSIGFVLWDAFPIPLFKWIDFQGHVKFMKRAFKDIDCVLQSWLDEHVKKRERVNFVEGNEEDFIDVMLSMMSNEDFVDGYSRETTIKATTLRCHEESPRRARHKCWQKQMGRRE
ncbi:hypothetical protein P3S67_032572 [Capsicum chacoense]